MYQFCCCFNELLVQKSEGDSLLHLVVPKLKRKKLVCAKRIPAWLFLQADTLVNIDQPKIVGAFDRNIDHSVVAA